MVNCKQMLIGGGKTETPKRLVGLDLMRISMALLIFAFHSQMNQLHCEYGLLNIFVSFGAIAMTGFMLLSGYVLSVTYSSKNLMEISNLKTFMIKRIISIIPLYFTIAILSTIDYVYQGSTNVRELIILTPIETLCLQSTINGLFKYLHNGGTWFISCIMICYICYPYIQHVLQSVGNKTKIYIFCLLAFIMLWAPIVTVSLGASSVYSNPFYRLVEFTIGAILFYISKEYSASRIIHRLATPFALICYCIALVVGITLALHFRLLPFDFMLYNLIALPMLVLIMLSLTHIQFSRLQDSRLIRYMSGLAFTFFLCQILPLWTISSAFMRLIGSDLNILKIIVSFTLCSLMAVAIHELIEKPATKYLKLKLLKL